MKADDTRQVTSARVHTGSLSRWYEQLCRLRHNTLGEIFNSKRGQLDYGEEDCGGVYCFWWTGEPSQLIGDSASTSMTLIGPSKSDVIVQFDEEWLGIASGLPVPLYIGKTARGVWQRAKLHLMLGKTRLLPTDLGTRKYKRPTTSCQVRSGIDQLFPGCSDTRQLVLKNVGISYVKLGGEENAVNRFYLENYAIGMMRPPFNIDVER